MSPLAFVRDIAACIFIIATIPITIYHSIQAARRSNIVGASLPHRAIWYLEGGWFAPKGIILH